MMRINVKMILSLISIDCKNSLVLLLLGIIYQYWIPIIDIHWQHYIALTRTLPILNAMNTMNTYPWYHWFISLTTSLWWQLLAGSRRSDRARRRGETRWRVPWRRLDEGCRGWVKPLGMTVPGNAHPKGPKKWREGLNLTLFELALTFRSFWRVCGPLSPAQMWFGSQFICQNCCYTCGYLWTLQSIYTLVIEHSYWK